MPCGDKESCNEFSQTHSTLTSKKGQSTSHPNETCTPFCSCACCASHFLKSDFQPNHTVVALIKSVYTVHKESKITFAIIPIWQPPKTA